MPPIPAPASYPPAAPGLPAGEAIIERLRAAKAAGLPTALGTYIFAGGFTFGIENAGFQVAGHVEHPKCAGFCLPSPQRWPVHIIDQRSSHAGSLMDRENEQTRFMSRLSESRLTPDLLYANPPCSAFAKQGKRQGMADDVMCFTNYQIAMAHTLLPKVWAWELVEGVWDEASGKEFIIELARRTTALGYDCAVFLTSAALHGGFQNRVRFHFLAKRRVDPIDAALGEEVHPEDNPADPIAPALQGYPPGDSHDSARGTPRAESWEALIDRVYAEAPASEKGLKTLGQALAMIPDDAPNHLEEKIDGGQLLRIMPFTPPGGYLRDVNSEVMRRNYTPHGKEWDGVSRAGVTQVRGRLDRACPVIVGGHSVIHPVHDRFLTVREAATAMGFPMDYIFSPGSKGMAEVGKGLTTANATIIGRIAMAAKDARIIPDASGLAVIDWRQKVRALGIPPMASTREDQIAWWKERHPTLPVEWAEQHRPSPEEVAVKAEQRAAKAAGKPVVPMKPKVTTVLISLSSDVGLMSTLKSFGIPLTDDPEQEFGLVLVGSDNDQFLMGVAVGRRVPWVKVDSKDPQAIIELAEHCGITRAKVIEALMAEVDPIELMRRRLAS